MNKKVESNKQGEIIQARLVIVVWGAIIGRTLEPVW